MKMNRPRDRLSGLPEGVRNHIVSFLTIKEAAKTTLLSTEWRNIISTLTHLIFRQEDSEEFVNHVVSRHDESTVDKFSVDVLIDDVQKSTQNIRKWISFAENKNAKEFNLSIRWITKRKQKLPDFLFTCSALTTLRLCYVILHSNTIFSCPFLKTLAFHKVKISQEKSDQDLCLDCNNCPHLERLLVGSISNVKTLTILSPTVEHLTLWDSGMAFDDRAVNLSVSNLQEIELNSPRTRNFNFNAASKVVKAHILLIPPLHSVSSNVLDVWASEILIGLPNVETLSVSISRDQILPQSRVLILEASSLHTAYYNTVKHMSLEMCPIEYQVRHSIFLLQRFPNLQTLVLQFKDSSLNRERNIYFPEEVPIGEALLQLQQVNIYSFGNDEAEQDIVKYLLEHAINLEKMKICCSVKIKEGFNINRVNLMELPKASSHAIIEIAPITSSTTN